MPTASPQTTRDRLEHEGENVHPDTQGGIELLRDTLAANQHFIDVDEHGDPEGYEFNLPQNTTGFHFYATDVGKKSLRKQTGVPEPADIAGWDMTDPWLSEGTLPVASPKLAAFGEYRPPAPVVVSVAGGKAGYPAGTYELYMTLRKRGSRRWTLPSAPVSFTLTTGQGITATLPDDLPRGLEVGLWLTRPNKAQATARLQKVIASGKRTATLYEYRSLERGRGLPTSNETMLATPPKIKVGGPRARRAMVRRGPAPGDLYPGDYRFTWWKVTAFGTTRASTNSDLVKVEGIPGVDEEGNPIELPVPGEAFIIRPPRKEPDVIGWVLGIQINGTPYALYRTNTLAGGASFLGFGHRPIKVYGDVSDSSSEQGTRGKQFALSQQEFPLENTSGMESPTGSPEAPTPFQASTSLAAVGTRRYAYAEVVSDGRGGEKVSLPSPSVEHTTASGEFARVLVPDPNNIFPNAEGRERGSDGIPLNCAVSGTNGSYRFEDGKHVISTDGNAYASDTVVFDLDRQEVNTAETYCFRGVLEAAITAGNADAVLYEYDAAGALIGTGTVLKSISSSGASPFEYRVGPNGNAAWQAGTVTARIRIRMSGGTRNMTIYAYKLAGHPYLMAPRKVEAGEPYQPANFAPSPERTYPRGVICETGPAPVTALEAATVEPLDTVDFTASATLPPTGWQHAQAWATSQITTADGVRMWEINDTTQAGSAFAYIHRSFTTEGDSLAIHVEEDLVSLPGGTSNIIQRDRIRDSVHGGLGWVDMRSTGGMRLTAVAQNGTVIEEGPFATASPGDHLDWELIASGVGTIDGTLTLLMGKNGAQRSVVGSISGIDWRGRTADSVWSGVIKESNPATRWHTRVHKVTVTESGDAIGDAAAPPAGETAPTPDRPRRTYSAWAASTAYAVGDRIEPTTANNHYYEATVAGTSGTTEPAWSTDGTTVTDGTVTWQDMGTVYHVTDVDGETINQLYFFVPPGYPRFDIDDVARWAVIPGESYTFGIRARRTIPVDEIAGKPWFLTLHNPETGEVVELGSPFAESTGVIAWADATLRVPSTGVIPAGFTELRVHFRDMGPGLWLFQDIGLSLGTLKRGYGCATSGWFRAVLKGKTPYVSPVATPLDGSWREIGAKADIPEGTSITPSYEHSNDLAVWTAFDPTAGLPEATYGAVRVDMTGDGRETPYVPAGSPYLSWFRALPTICREDGTSFSGGTLVGDILPAFARPEYESDRVGGHNIHTDVTEAVNRIRNGFRVGFENESDALLFARNCLEENWILEVPQHGGTVAGKRYVIDIDEAVNPPEEIDEGPHKDPIFNGYRNVRSVVEVSGCEVLEEGQL